jgi:hypothetical protein
MTNFKRFSIAAALSAAITTPAIAQQAVQEPGLLAFYQSLGVVSFKSDSVRARTSWQRLFIVECGC